MLKDVLNLVSHNLGNYLETWRNASTRWRRVVRAWLHRYCSSFVWRLFVNIPMLTIGLLVLSLGKATSNPANCQVVVRVLISAEI